ncbi:MAG TPA: ArsB/NhaD family transporter [Dehalococcoidia bacterium]|nr:ArsB/NhaD family transporter [Dehalococcoidia bacterium]
MLRDALAIGLFALTIAAVLVRPRGLPEAGAATAGALLAMLLGVVSPGQAWRAVAAQWDVLLFFAGLLLVCRVAEEAGIFAWAALATARHARGNCTRLFLNICLAGVLLTTLLSNDATALLLTTTVVALTQMIEVPPLPFALACAFIANGASLTLPVSNPLNVLVLGTGRMRLHTYLLHMLPASVVVVALTIALLWFCLRGRLRGGFDTSKLQAPGAGVPKSPLFRITAAALAVLALAYIAASTLGWPVSVPVAIAGVSLAACARLVGRLPARNVARAPWAILPFVAGLLVLVRGLERSGLTGQLAELLLALDRRGAVAATFGATFTSATGANAINNLPMGAVMLSALRASGPGHPALLYGTLLGSDVGPNLTVLGSLSSMLWLLLLRQRGVAVSAREFACYGALLAPMALVGGALAISLGLRV